MTLTAKLTRKSIKVCYFNLENPFYGIIREEANFYFRSTFVIPLETLFKNKNTEEKVIEFYKNFPWKLSSRKYNRNVIDINGQIYSWGGGSLLDNFDGTKTLALEFWRKRNLREYLPLAIENLTAVVQDKDLSFGDKKIIKDVALKSFFSMIKFVTTGENGRSNNFEDCVRTDLNESACCELMDYGFAIKHLYDWVADLDLKKQ